MAGRNHLLDPDDLGRKLLVNSVESALKKGELKVYKGFPHGMATTEADTINKDLLAFFKA